MHLRSFAEYTNRVADPQEPGPRAKTWILLACLALTALPFLPGLSGEFVYDDLAMVVRNPRTTGLEHVPEILTSPMLDFLDPQTASHIGYWRPVAGLGLIAGASLAGGRPIGFHVVSLLLHLAATAVAFRLAARLTKSTPTAFFAALLFGLHPTHVEGVSWISAINDPLFGLFSLLSLDAFVAWRDEGSKGSPWKAALWLLPALLSKEMAAAVVPMAIAIDLARARTLQPVVRAYGAFAIAVAAYYIARMAVFGDVFAGFDRTTTDFGVPPLRLFELRFELLGGFLWLLAWPADLNLFRPFRPEVPFGDPELLRALACIVLLCACAWWLWKKRSGLFLACVLLLPAALSPALVRVESLGIFPMSDRFLYLAALGWGILLAAVLVRALPRRAAFAVLTLVAVAYGVRTYARTGFWRDEDTLFATAVKQSPNSPYVHWGYARVLLQRYRDRNDVDALRKAHDEAQTALDLLERAQKGDSGVLNMRDDYVQANLCLAESLLAEAKIDPFHDYETVKAVFQSIATHYPDNPYAQSGLGVALTELHRYDEADAAFAKAIQLNPRYAEAHHNRGILRIRRADPKGAAESFERALANRPDGLDDLVWLARARAEAGDRTGALAAATRAHERYPRAPGPLVVLGTIAAKAGDLEEGLRRFEEALRGTPDDGEALLQKSKVLLARGEKNSAKVALLRACDVLPESFEAHYNAGVLMLQEGGIKSALPYLERAYGVRPDDANGKLLHDRLVEMAIDDPDVLARFAAADADRGDKASAGEWLERALARKPDHGPSLYMKGMLLRKSGDDDAAEPLLRRACDAMPGSLEAHLQLGGLLLKQARDAEALPILERALEIATRASPGVEGAETPLAELRATVARLKNAPK